MWSINIKQKRNNSLYNVLYSSMDSYGYYKTTHNTIYQLIRSSVVPQIKTIVNYTVKTT